MPLEQEGRPAEPDGASQSRFLAGNDGEGTALGPTRQSPTPVAGRVSFRIAVFRNIDPDCPSGERFVAHWFDRLGALQVATAAGPAEECCRERLTAFLSAEIAKASVARGIPRLPRATALEPKRLGRRRRPSERRPVPHERPRQRRPGFKSRPA
jgi:hypothetical protein